MAANALKSFTQEERSLVSSIIMCSQLYIRKSEGDSSAASLRDVKRCLKLILWFGEVLKIRKKEGATEESMSSNVPAIILGLAFVYYYRLKNNSSRSEYWGEIREAGEWDSRHLKRFG